MTPCACCGADDETAIVEAVAKGDLTPSEAAELSKVIDSFARTLEAADFEERLTRLEHAVVAPGGLGIPGNTQLERSRAGVSAERMK